MLLLTHSVGFFLNYRSGYNMYYKALLANSAASALHLFQFLMNGEFNEESVHYLLYSTIFVYSPPVMCKLIFLVTLEGLVIFTGTFIPSGVLLPVLILALIHISSYYIGLIDVRPFKITNSTI